MKFEIKYNDNCSYYGEKGWDVILNDKILNNNKWTKEKVIKVITTIIEVIEES